MKVVNRHSERFQIYIGRGTMWGNPYIIGRDGSREVVLDKYKKYLWQRMKDQGFRKALMNLDGKILGCSCKPLPCHGDILVNAIAWLKGRRTGQ